MDCQYLGPGMRRAFQQEELRTRSGRFTGLQRQREEIRWLESFLPEFRNNPRRDPTICLELHQILVNHYDNYLSALRQAHQAGKVGDFLFSGEVLGRCPGCPQGLLVESGATEELVKMYREPRKMLALSHATDLLAANSTNHSFSLAEKILFVQIAVQELTQKPRLENNPRYHATQDSKYIPFDLSGCQQGKQVKSTVGRCNACKISFCTACHGRVEDPPEESKSDNPKSDNPKSDAPQSDSSAVVVSPPTPHVCPPLPAPQKTTPRPPGDQGPVSCETYQHQPDQTVPRVLLPRGACVWVSPGVLHGVPDAFLLGHPGDLPERRDGSAEPRLYRFLCQ